MDNLVPSIYVGDLHPDVTEQQLFETFLCCGSISSIKIPKATDGRSKGYAYINFFLLDDARGAFALNYQELCGVPIRIMWLEPDARARMTGVGNIFVKNLPEVVNSKFLSNYFTDFGKVISCKVPATSEGIMGYGFVRFDSEEHAELAIEKANGALIFDRKIYVGKFKSREERNKERGAMRERKSSEGSLDTLWNKGGGYDVSSKISIFDSLQDLNLYVRDLPFDYDDEQLAGLFSEFGQIYSAKVMTAAGKSRGYGFVCYYRTEDARQAIGTMHGRVIDGQIISVSFAEKSSEKSRLEKWKKIPSGIKAFSNLLWERKPDYDDQRLEFFPSPGAVGDSVKKTTITQHKDHPEEIKNMNNFFEKATENIFSKKEIESNGVQLRCRVHLMLMEMPTIKPLEECFRTIYPLVEASYGLNAVIITYKILEEYRRSVYKIFEIDFPLKDKVHEIATKLGISEKIAPQFKFQQAPQALSY